MGYRIGLVINPLAGIGGRLGYKGSDGAYAIRALLKGAKPIAPERARRFVRRLKLPLEVLAPVGVMGVDSVSSVNPRVRLSPVECVGRRTWPTTAADTRRCVGEIRDQGVDLLVFVGGDGTARDVYSVIGDSLPVVGVPSGVKVYSAVFAVDPESAAMAVEDYLHGRAGLVDSEVVDVDEDLFRRGELRLRLYGYMKTPATRYMVSTSKQPIASDAREEAEAIAEYLVSELMEECTLYILGPGTTIKAIADRLGVRKTLLGVDAVHNGRLVGEDLDEEGILSLLEGYRRVKVLISPIGGQGYILGRGNQQVSPEVLKRIGIDNIIVIATPSKLATIKTLRVDTGDPSIDKALKGRYIKVLTAPYRYKLVRIE